MGGLRIFGYAFLVGLVLLFGVAPNIAEWVKLLPFEIGGDIAGLAKELAYAFLISGVVGTSIEVHAAKRHHALMDEAQRANRALVRKAKDEFIDLAKHVSAETSRLGLMAAAPITSYCSLTDVVNDIMKSKFARKEFEISVTIYVEDGEVRVRNELNWELMNLTDRDNVHDYRFEFDSRFEGISGGLEIVEWSFGNEKFDVARLAKEEMLELVAGTNVVRAVRNQIAVPGNKSVWTKAHFIEKRTRTDCSFWVMTMPCQALTLKVSCPEDFRYVVEALHPKDAFHDKNRDTQYWHFWELTGGLLPGQGLLIRWTG